MKFRYIAVNDDGELVGTNDRELAQHLSTNDGLYVFDVTTGLSLDHPPIEMAEAEDTRDPDDADED